MAETFYYPFSNNMITILQLFWFSAKLVWEDLLAWIYLLSIGLTRISGTEKIYILYTSETDKILGINSTDILTYSNSLKLSYADRNVMVNFTKKWETEDGFAVTQKAREEKAIRVQLYPHEESTLWPFGYYSRCTTTTLQAKCGWTKALPLEALHNYTPDLQIRPGQGFRLFGYPRSFFIQVYGILVLQDMGIKYPNFWFGI